MIEFIGFVISLLALVFIFFKNSQQQARPPQKHPREVKQEEEEENDPLNEWIRAIEQEATPKEAAQHVPPPPPKVVKQAKKAVGKGGVPHKMEKRPLKMPLEPARLKSTESQHQELLKRVKPPLLGHRIEDHEHVAPSRAKKVLQRLSQRRDLVIYQEIISPPKSLRPPL